MQPASRIAFVMKTIFIHLSWMGGEGIGSITPTVRMPLDVRAMKITPKGFRLTFTEPLVPQ